MLADGPGDGRLSLHGDRRFHGSFHYFLTNVIPHLLGVKLLQWQTPPIRGTRVLVSVIVDDVAADVAREDILRNYAALADPDIDAALAYAAELTREGTVDLPLEIKA